VSYDRGAWTTVTELRNRPVNGEPRESHLGVFAFFGQYFQWSEKGATAERARRERRVASRSHDPPHVGRRTLFFSPAKGPPVNSVVATGVRLTHRYGTAQTGDECAEALMAPAFTR
jgi:hypothetical protein